MSPRFCASCTEERDDLVAEWLDGRLVHLCRDCSQGELRGGRWTFDGGEVDRRLAPATVHLARLVSTVSRRRYPGGS